MTALFVQESVEGRTVLLVLVCGLREPTKPVVSPKISGTPTCYCGISLKYNRSEHRSLLNPGVLTKSDVSVPCST